MNDNDRKTRLKRIIKVLGELRQAELNERNRLYALHVNATDAAAAIDAMDASASITWAEFPGSWLEYRINLETKILDTNRMAKTHGINALHFEKAAERIATEISAIERTKLANHLTEEILQTLAHDSDKERSGSNKFGDLDNRPDNRRR